MASSSAECWVLSAVQRRGECSTEHSAPSTQHSVRDAGALGDGDDLAVPLVGGLGGRDHHLPHGAGTLDDVRHLGGGGEHVARLDHVVVLDLGATVEDS